MLQVRIAMHELKVGLSRYVAQARAGAVIEITSHDKPVARLVGMPAPMPAGLAGLLASGQASWTGGKPVWAPAVALPARARSMSDGVVEDRG
jgi:prevent-host-death family protein